MSAFLPTTRSAAAVAHRPEYHAWRMAIARCHNPKAKAYGRYGARGITVCDRWRESFDAFLADMGPRPSDRHELDRADNSKGYEPENCRWVERWQNDRNRRSNLWVEYRGQRRLLLELCEEFNVWPDTVRYRLRAGWGVERAVETPTRLRIDARGPVETARTRSAAMQSPKAVAS